jgi:hypothetical protein
MAGGKLLPEYSSRILDVTLAAAPRSMFRIRRPTRCLHRRDGAGAQPDACDPQHKGLHIHWSETPEPLGTVSAAFPIVFASAQCNITDDSACDEKKREAESAAPAAVMSDAILNMPLGRREGGNCRAQSQETGRNRR